MDLPDDCTLGYIVGHQAWYWMGDRPNRPRYVRVGADSSDGGCLWEFMIEEHVFTSREAALRVCLFDDAWQAYAQVPELFAALAADRPQTFDELRIVLDRVGARDITARDRVADGH
jgi:hypothetical protein